MQSNRQRCYSSSCVQLNRTFFYSKVTEWLKPTNSHKTSFNEAPCEKGKEQVKALNYLSSFLSVGAIIACLALSLRIINLQSIVSLVIFNVLFISLPFHLNGSLNRKLCLLALGNMTGLCWNYVFNLFAIVATNAFGKIFLDVYTVFFPFLSSIWIVSFWALSLTVLHRNRTDQGVQL